MKKDPKTKSLYGKELMDLLTQKIHKYDGNKDKMIKSYLDEVKRNLLLNITHYAKSDTFMRSETSDDTQEAQPCE
ncbi:hypothetical protein H5410_060452 [Solanum commersonii]|uniref:Uncharacterized protein n=1 Tax=Solanum commersonii TaxID=4109 RepID=A0A9J5W6K9_SOLCO|nr:hypothetical protein H5410_060452 [Solanum commersonii]